MATKKPAKTTAKKSSTKKPKTTAAKTANKSVANKSKTVGEKTNDNASVATDGKIFKGFFAKKFDTNENILTIFKNKRIWGALIGEFIGTAFLCMLFLTLGVQPLYLVFGTIGITIAVFALSGANLNPLITAGMMASRRMSAIRGVLYILAQILGAWVGLLVINGFRLASGTQSELPVMGEVTGETFWTVALVEMLGALFMGFFFARALQYKRSALTFATVIASGLTFAVIVGIVVSQSFFEFTGTTFVYNPAIALMYQILPSAADSFGQLMGGICLALLTYVIFPMIGGIIGFTISDVASRFKGECCCSCEKSQK